MEYKRFRNATRDCYLKFESFEWQHDEQYTQQQQQNDTLRRLETRIKITEALVSIGIQQVKAST